MGRKRKNQDLNPTQNEGQALDSSMINRMDSPKYGSATKEIEALTAEKHRVASFLAKLNPNIPISSPNPNPDGLSPVLNSYNRNNPFGKSSGSKCSISINLDDDDDEEEEREEKILNGKTEKELEIKKEIIMEEKNKGAIIVLDSDDENETENDYTNGMENENTPISAQNVAGFDMNSLVQSSDLNLARNQFMSPTTEVQNQFMSSNLNFSQNQFMSPYTEAQSQFTPPLKQLSPSPRTNPQLFRNGSFQTPQVQYSKVFLRDYTKEEREKDRQVAESVEKRAEAEPQVNSISKTYERKKRKTRSDLGRTKPRKPDESSPKSQLESPAELDDEDERVSEKEVDEDDDDGLEDLWKDMSLAMEYSKAEEKKEEEEKEEEEEEEGDDDVCSHVFLLKDDVGLVCRVCGVIQKKIEQIFEFTFKKSKRAGRSFYDPNKPRQESDKTSDFKTLNLPQDDFSVSEIFLHPRHNRNIKPHQKEGFDFLVKNLVCENPGGCILAHAPGSGKTFMLIAFIQSFLAKYPNARPMVVLPKGILSTWKKEFQRWQVEDILLLDFYSSKAEKRSEQLKILDEWKDNRSILFLGYQQFASIICDSKNGSVGSACQERLLKVPGLLIIDEGHTPRNEDTNVLGSLAKVQTKRKVVLSGTLFQNHVHEVFNILNLVRPKFLKTETAQCIVKRILSRVSISGSRRLNENGFYDLVEETLRSVDSFNRKIRVIQDLRELTHNVLHYYKGDFLDELPGLVDLTVMLKMTKKQEENLRKIANYDKFKMSSVSTAIYMHPKLSEISEISFTERAANCTDSKMDNLVEDINVKEGAKMKFFLNILNLAESAGEKCLAFSQYIVPLKFLERYLVHTKGWRVGKEIFVISGDSSSDDRERSMEQFNKSSEAKVLFGSIKACGEGISLVGASRVIILDVHINPSVTRQAIGRAFRPGQEKKVFIYRLVAVDSSEEKVHQTSFRKELISKMWFEWSEFSRDQEFELDEVAVEKSGDLFLESSAVREDIESLYKR
ncbi:hypothetical protein LUZ60_001487 [Juncus effusus]|nr:hypothetical protein LUZ60_001487 [Juncus effusus]